MPSSGVTPLADKLRAGLRAAEIPAPEGDIERLIEAGVLSRMEDHVRAIRGVPPDTAPEHVVGAPPPPTSRGGQSRTFAPSASEPGGGLPDTIVAVASLVRARAVSPVELVERSLARIADRDGELNAFQLVLDERARDAARAAESDIGAGRWRGPLHGVPVAVKDLFAMKDTVTTAGGRRATWTPSEVSSVVVERLERAGAVVVGKTRLPEFAFWPGSTNPHYGPTANPRDTTRDAGGSSSGSAAAVADGMAYAAIGSDTGGSIRIPAALCGVVGLKPTYGRVCLDGCVPLAWSLDHAGPLTRCVDDAALLLDVLGGDSSDAWSAAFPRGADALRVGVLADDGSDRPLASGQAMEHWRASLRALEHAGAKLVDVDLPEMATLRAVNFMILSVEAATYHAPGLRERYDDYGEPCRSRLLSGYAYDGADYVQAQRYRRRVRQLWSGLFERIDVLATPSQPDVAPPLGEMGSTKHTSPFNALGWPAISVPFGQDGGGLPLATQLVGAPWREATVLRAARVLETDQ